MPFDSTVGVSTTFVPAVGAPIYTGARVDAAPFTAVGEGVMLPFLLLLVLPFTLLLG